MPDTLPRALCRLLLLASLSPTVLVAAECAEDEYRTEVGGCYPVWYGQTANGSYYTIAIPMGWRPDKGLVIWNHGLQTYLNDDTVDLLVATLLGLETPADVKVAGKVEPKPGLGALASIVLSQGYAMAASSFLQTGWAVFDSHRANAELYQRFLDIAAEFGAGEPTPLYLLGGSMGGIVSLRDIEEQLIPRPDGALLLCGAVAGSENWRNAFDLRMITEAICADNGASRFPAPWYEIPDLGDEIDWLKELNSCTGLLGRITAEDKINELQRQIDNLRARKDVEGNVFRKLDLQRRIGGREAEQRVWLKGWEQLASSRQVSNYERIQRLVPTRSAMMLTVDLFYGTFLLPRLIQESGKLGGINPFHNIAVDYRDAQLNRHITRRVGLPAERRALARNYNPAGTIGDTRIISIHTSKDGIVTVENQAVLQSRVAPEQLTVGVVAESTPSHCDFRESEVIAAWNLLQQWVAEGSQPDVADLQQECNAVSNRTEQGAIPWDWERAPDAELHPGNRCRYAADFEVGSQLTLFPRVPAMLAAGNEYDHATGVIAVPESVVKMDNGNQLFGYDLVLTDPERLVFAPRNIKPLGPTADNWRHRAALDYQNRFYLPDMYVNNHPQLSGRRFNLYMQVNDDYSRFRFLDFEPAARRP